MIVGRSKFLLFFCSLFLCYAVCEVTLRISLDKIPRNLFNFFDDELQILGQTSKRALLPSDGYIAILGDSYGLGQGDWFADNKFNRNSRYQAAHILQNKLARDVLSFSLAGAGNYDGAALFAINAHKLIKRHGLHLTKPKYLIVYFYEGNDIENNLRFYERYYAPAFERESLFDDKNFDYFESKLERKYLQGKPRNIEGNFLFAKAIGSAFEYLVKRIKLDQMDKGQNDGPQALIAGQRVALNEDVWKEDILRHSEQEIKLSNRFLERALLRAKEYFRADHNLLIYIPSPASTYQLVEERQNRAKRTKLHLLSRELVGSTADKHKFSFVDLSPKLQQKAREILVHGPKDCLHFNKRGYELLADSIVKSLR